TLLIRC
ncbi:methyltransferase domain protein, partial [Vibrio parahaemolyticus EKP-026]